MKKHFFALFCLLLSISLFAQNTTEKERVIETVTKDQIKGHIYFLADDLLKGRETGTPENKIAAAYLANTFRAYGITPNPETGSYYQEVPLTKTEAPTDMAFAIGSEKYTKFVAFGGEPINFGGQAVYAGYGMETDYKDIDVRKKFVVVKAGSPTAQDAQAAYALREQKKNWAKDNGATGLIEFVQTNAQIWDYIDHNFNGGSVQLSSEEKKDKGNTFHHFWVFDADGSGINAVKADKETKFQASVRREAPKEIVSYNVVGMIPGTDPELKKEYIIYSAHYDHVGIGKPDETGDTIYNGARDNAVGTTTVLSMAQNLAKYPTKRSALFILFTGEEKGLLGSNYYVNHPILPLDQMVFCFNSDNGGYNDTSLATIIGLNRTTAGNTIKNAVAQFGLNAIEDPAPEQGLFDRSDNVHFAKKGIPAPTFSMGFTAFNGDVTKYYHRPGDEVDSIDFEYLETFFRAYVLSGRAIANDPETPFWSKGDTYEAAGKQLYGN